MHVEILGQTYSRIMDYIRDLRGTAEIAPQSQYNAILEILYNYQ